MQYNSVKVWREFTSKLMKMPIFSTQDAIQSPFVGLLDNFSYATTKMNAHFFPPRQNTEQDHMIEAWCIMLWQ